MLPLEASRDMVRGVLGWVGKIEGDTLWWLSLSTAKATTAGHSQINRNKIVYC